MLRAKIAKGAAWMVLFRMLDRVLGLASTFILARLLSPSDFGIVAMAMSVIAMIELASAFSFDVPLIQRVSLTKDHYDTAWTLNLLFAAVCGLATAAFAQPASAFFEEPRLVPVMLVLAAGWVIQGFENVAIVNFRRSLQFHRETAFLLGKRLSGFLVGVCLAFWLRSYWALVAGLLTGRIMGVLLGYWMEPYRPRFSLRARADLFAISAWLFINNVLHFAIMRVSHFMIGRLFDARALGLYSVGTELAYIPQTQLIAPVNRAMFPGYSRLIAKGGQIGAGFVEVNAFIAAFALPAAVGIAVLAEPLVRVVLGDQWMEAVPLVEILAFAGAVSALASNTYSACLAIGRPYIATLWLVVELAVIAPALVVLPARYGLHGIAYAELIAIGAGALCGYPVLLKILKIDSLAYLSNLWRPVVASAAMGFVVARVIGELDSGFPEVTKLLMGVLVGVVSYGAALYGLWYASGCPNGAEQMLLGQVLSRVQRRALQPASEEGR